jgi:nitroreductase
VNNNNNFINEVIRAIYTRRSVREYKDKKISEDIIKNILNAAVMAPSSNNYQPWNFSIVTSKEKIEDFAEIACNIINEKGIVEEYDVQFKPYDIFYDAPLLIIISGKKNYKWLKDDINLAVQNMFLAAQSLNIGSCWIGNAIVLDEVEDVRNQLGIPNDFTIVAPLIFGYPEKIDKIIPERNINILKWIKD